MLLRIVKHELFNIKEILVTSEKCHWSSYQILPLIKTKRWAIVTLEASMELSRTQLNSPPSIIPQVVRTPSPSYFGKTWQTQFWSLQLTTTPGSTSYPRTKETWSLWRSQSAQRLKTSTYLRLTRAATTCTARLHLLRNKTSTNIYSCNRS